jgi:hypothetical protein
MFPNVAFDEPVLVHIASEPVRTVEQAAQIVRLHLQAKFTIHRLNTLLALERAADGSEIAEARAAFYSWACAERTDLD